ncbi:MAG TPA: alpha/beta hydrolase [Actinophytocola sp.]|uniref:alpha/beta hydrolase n=1 Tax=Actinophytocola sp. TaxID=1872138 RepID=UPI002DBAFF67|nr:alpha/beta hydrolase [Actinophytocola sp.]HEU5474866.1 alpha/beta hydrolase [Actinophytocola sp.]
MAKAMNNIPVGIQGAAMRGVFALPAPVRRRIAGRPVRIDGNELALDAQLLLRLTKATELKLSDGSVADARRNVEQMSPVVGGRPIEPVRATQLRIPVAGGDIPARLYTPAGLPAGSPLLVYYHGGGFSIGSIDSHDNLCRFLAREAGLRVLSAGYRLAPEAPFPTAPADALAAFEYAAEHAAELGADPAAIAVGGDSAGGNLAAVTSYQALRNGGPRPAFQLLYYPATDASRRYRSQDLFADGFFLTDEDIQWFNGNYFPDREMERDPLGSPLLADDLRGMPPTYLSTAGFDPLRDEGEAYAAKLREAGVPVVAHRIGDLIHGYVSLIGVGRRFREAVAESAGVLRAGLALRADGRDLFGAPANAKTGKAHGNPAQPN